MTDFGKWESFNADAAEAEVERQVGCVAFGTVTMQMFWTARPGGRLPGLGRYAVRVGDKDSR